MRKPHTLMLMLGICVAPAAGAATFTWTSNPAVITGERSVSLTVDRITATVQGYVAEIDGDDARVFGPMPTAPDSRGDPIFGLYRGSALGLIAQPAPGAALSGTDRAFANVGPGFNNWYWSTGDVQKMDIAVIAFDAPVDVGAVEVWGVSNYGRPIWMATGSNAPDFSAGLLAGLAGFSIANSLDTASNGFFRHSLGATDVSWLVLGPAPRLADLGPLAGGYGLSQFYLHGLGDVMPSAAPAPIPLPATGLLALAGVGALFGLGAARRRRGAPA